MSDLKSIIEENAQGPAKASGDSGSMEQHKLTDQIEADKYLAGKTAMSNNKLGGIKICKIKPPGTI